MWISLKGVQNLWNKTEFEWLCINNEYIPLKLYILKGCLCRGTNFKTLLRILLTVRNGRKLYQLIFMQNST